MGIEIRPSGESAAYSQAGKIIGKGERAKEERARQQQLQSQQLAMDWERQKMLLNSQQDFAHEQRMRQAQLNAEARAEEWELEKMEIASRLDFQQKEKARQMEMSKYQTYADTLQSEIDKGTVNENDPSWPQIQERLRRYRAKAAGLDAPASLYNVASSQKDPTIELRKQLSAVVGTQEAATMSLPELIEEAKNLGYSVSNLEEPFTQDTEQNPITAINPNTKERIVSYDGGKTWKPI